MPINDVKGQLIVEHKNHAQLRSAQTILHVFKTRNSGVYLRTEEHSILRWYGIRLRPKVCCNVAG